jgi:hypothetical protein
MSDKPDELNETLEEGQAEATVDRRVFPRVGASFPVDFQVLEKGQIELDPKDGHTAVVKNISVEGICFTSSEYLDPRRLLALEVHIPGSKEPVPCVGKVAWCRPSPVISNMFETGIELMWAGLGDEESQIEINLFVRNALAHGKESDGENAS